MKQNEILFFLGSICILVFAWIAFSLVHASFTSTVGDETIQSILPISPAFDTNTINSMGKKKNVLPQVVIQPQQQTDVIVTSSPSLTPTPVLTVAPQKVATEGASSQ